MITYYANELHEAYADVDEERLTLTGERSDRWIVILEQVVKQSLIICYVVASHYKIQISRHNSRTIAHFQDKISTDFKQQPTKKKPVLSS